MNYSSFVLRNMIKKIIKVANEQLDQKQLLAELPESLDSGYKVSHVPLQELIRQYEENDDDDTQFIITDNLQLHKSLFDLVQEKAWDQAAARLVEGKPKSPGMMIRAWQWLVIKPLSDLFDSESVSVKTKKSRSQLFAFTKQLGEEGIDGATFLAKPVDRRLQPLRKDDPGYVEPVAVKLFSEFRPTLEDDELVPRGTLPQLHREAMANRVLYKRGELVQKRLFGYKMLVMEALPGKPLHFLDLSKLNTSDKIAIAAQISYQLNRLHLCCVHNDIAKRNIVVNLRIDDFVDNFGKRLSINRVEANLIDFGRVKFLRDYTSAEEQRDAIEKDINDFYRVIYELNMLEGYQYASQIQPILSQFNHRLPNVTTTHLAAFYNTLAQLNECLTERGLTDPQSEAFLSKLASLAVVADEQGLSHVNAAATAASLAWKKQANETLQQPASFGMFHHNATAFNQSPAEVASQSQATSSHDIGIEQPRIAAFIV